MQIASRIEADLRNKRHTYNERLALMELVEKLNVLTRKKSVSQARVVQNYYEKLLDQYLSFVKEDDIKELDEQIRVVQRYVINTWSSEDIRSYLQGRSLSDPAPSLISVAVFDMPHVNPTLVRKVLSALRRESCKKTNTTKRSASRSSRRTAS